MCVPVHLPPVSGDVRGLFFLFFIIFSSNKTRHRELTHPPNHQVTHNLVVPLILSSPFIMIRSAKQLTHLCKAKAKMTEHGLTVGSVSNAWKRRQQTCCYVENLSHIIKGVTFFGRFCLEEKFAKQKLILPKPLSTAMFLCTWLYQKTLVNACFCIPFSKHPYVKKCQLSGTREGAKLYHLESP